MGTQENSIKKAGAVLATIQRQPVSTLPTRLPSSTEITLRETFKAPSEVIHFFSVDGVAERRKKLGLKDLVEISGREYTTLQNVKNVFGEQTAIEIIRLYLIRTVELLYVTDEKMSSAQMTDTAQTIIDEYPRLKITELHEFFRRFKAGYYPELYGSIDIRKIMVSLKQFIVERNQAKMEFNRRIEKRRREEQDRISAEKRKTGEYIDYQTYRDRLTPEESLERNLCPEKGCIGHLITAGEKKYCDMCSWKNFDDTATQ